MKYRKEVLDTFAANMGFLEGTQDEEYKLLSTIEMDGEIYSIEEDAFGYRVTNKDGFVVDGSFADEGSTFYKVMDLFDKQVTKKEDPFGSLGLPSDDDIVGLLDPSEVNEVEALINKFENTCV